MEKKQKPKVMIYCNAPWPFRTTVVGYLYEIAKVFPSVLLIGKGSQNLDTETESALKNKKIFPFLEKIISIQQLNGKMADLFKKNKYYCQLAKNIINRHKPDIVIVTTDVYLFDFYLLRYAKKIGAVTANIHSALHSVNFKDLPWIVDRTNAYSRFPLLRSFFLKLIFAKTRKYLGYLLYNFILPILNWEKPFGGSSVILHSPAGQRADYVIGASKNEYNLFLKEGLPEEKIYILKHPLYRKSARKFFRQIYFLPARKDYNQTKKALTLLFPSIEFWFRKKDKSIISKEVFSDHTFEIINLLAKILNDWIIFIKPHPDRSFRDELKEKLLAVSPRQIRFAEPTDPVDRYIEISDVVVGLNPPSMSVFISSIQNSKKIVLTVDFLDQFLGDFFKDFSGIKHVNNKEKLIKILELIKENRYNKEKQSKEVNVFEKKEFRDAVEMVNFLIEDSFQKNNSDSLTDKKI